MANIAELIAQKEEIEQKIKELRKSERHAAIAKVREIIAEFDLMADEVFAKAAKGVRTKATPKYRDPASGKTWTGRGRSPRWLNGNNANEFLIK
jgi:DNA-binding protein H-NS